MDIKTIPDLKKAMIDADIFEKYHLDKIGVYGSFARGEDFNDIDLYIDEDEPKLDYWAFKEELTALFGIKVDVMVKPYANPVILYYAEKDMIYVTKD